MLNTIINNPIFLTFSIIIILLVIWNIILYLQIFKLKKRLKSFFNGKNSADLEGVLYEEIKRLKKAEKDIKELTRFSETLNQIAQKSVQKVGVIRFNPFKETGGDQSFSIALLDSKNNGVVISSLFTREGNRVYGKPIIEGKSKYPLSQEELTALKQADK